MQLELLGKLTGLGEFSHFDITTLVIIKALPGYIYTFRDTYA